MFRRFVSSGVRLAGFVLAGAGSAQLAAVAVTASKEGGGKPPPMKAAPTDAELANKPFWYREIVHELEEVLKETGQYTPIESEETLEKAYDTLIRVKDQQHVEILWRLARVHVEKAIIATSHHEQEHLLHEVVLPRPHGMLYPIITATQLQAIEYCHKAMAIEPAKGSSGTHKWYALALEKLAQVDSKLEKTVNVHEEMKKHLEKAVQADPKDAYAWLFLGRQYAKEKNYKEALKCSKKGEELKPGFSAANLQLLGDSLLHEGNKEEAKEVYTKCVLSPTVCTMLDCKAKSDAKLRLTKVFKVDLKTLLPVF